MRAAGVSSFFLIRGLVVTGRHVKGKKLRLFGDDIADWLEGSELVGGR